MRLHPCAGGQDQLRNGLFPADVWGRGGKGRLVYLGRLLQTRPHPGWKFQKGAFDRIGGRAEEEERAALSSEGKGRARGCVYARSRADTDNLLLHLLPPDLKSVARSPVFTVSPFFARPPYVSRQFVIAPSEKMAKRTTFRFPLNYPLSESLARVEGGGSKGGFFLVIRCASRLPRGCPDRFLCVESSSRKGCWVYERWLIAPFTLPRDFMAERRTIEKSVETERSA